jgi:hypothetical protein
MKTFKRNLLSLASALLVVGVLALGAMLPVQQAHAATPNFSASNPSVVVMPFHISGQYTATTAAVVKFNIPFKAKVIGVGASARASGGTSPTLTVDLKNGVTSMLSAPIAVTAGAYAEGTLTTTTLADEATVNVDLAITGTSPTWNDITVLITLLRL